MLYLISEGGDNREISAYNIGWIVWGVVEGNNWVSQKYTDYKRRND